MQKEVVSILPSIEPAEGNSEHWIAQDARDSIENGEHTANRLVRIDDSVPISSDSPTIVKSRSLTKKIRERQVRDNGAVNSGESEKGIPAIVGAKGVRDSTCTNIDDGIASLGAGGYESSLFTSSGKQQIPSVLSTPTRTRTNSSSGTLTSEAAGQEIVMPSLPLHMLRPSHNSSDNLQEVANDISKARTMESPAPIGGSPPAHNASTTAHLHHPHAGLAPLPTTSVSSSAHIASHYLATSGSKSERQTSKPLEKIHPSELAGAHSHSQPCSGRQQHHRSGSGTSLGASNSSGKLSALTHSPAHTSAKARVSSGSASTLMAVHGLQPAPALPDRQERQYLQALEVTHKGAGQALTTAEQDVDRVVQERLLEAKAMDRKNTPGAVMHQFSLWNKAATSAPAAAPVPSPALRSQSEPVASALSAVPAGLSALNITHPIPHAEEHHLTPRSSHKKLSALPREDLAAVSTQSKGSTSESFGTAKKTASKLRGPKAAREVHTVQDDDDRHADSTSPLNTSVGEGLHIKPVPSAVASLQGSRDPLDEEYTLEFEPFHAAGNEERPSGQTGTNSSLATSLRRKVVGAKLPVTVSVMEESSPEAKHGDAQNNMFTTPEKKSTAVLTPSAAHVTPLTEGNDQEGSDSGGWHSDDNIEEDEDLQRLSAGLERPRSAEPSHTAEAAAIKSMSQSGPAAFAAMKVSASMNVSQGKLETGFASAGNLSEQLDVTGSLPMRRATTTGDNRHFVDRLEHLVNASGAETGGQLLKSMTSRSASECNISFDPVNQPHSSTKGGSSKYQTLRNLKSSKSITHHSVSEKTSSTEAQGAQGAQPSQKDIAGYEVQLGSASTRSRSNTINTQLPLSTLLSPLEAPVDTGEPSARSRDDASPALSEVSDAEDPAEVKAQRSPLRVDLEGNRERTASDHNLTGLVSEQDAEDSPLRWRKGEVIGEGTFGKVYKGMNEKTGELLAIKQLCLIDGTSVEVESLRKEISVMWDLEHENIVRYLGTSKSERYLFIILEYVTGGSIAGMITQFGPFNEKLIKRFSLHILSGVDYLHSKGIIHRDIKGANILVSGAGVAKLADFGCSKQLAGMCTASIEESLKAIRGSVPWMAPEVIKQSGHGRSSDIWSVGATVIEMATGKPPWPEFSNSLAALFHVATSKTPPPMPTEVSQLCCDFLARCLVIEPADRATAQELLLESEFLNGASAPAPLPINGASTTANGAGAINASSGVATRPRSNSATPTTTPRLP